MKHLVIANLPDGSVDVRLGTYGPNGIYKYDGQSAVDAFRSEDLMRRIANGTMRGEFGMPCLEGKNYAERTLRLHSVDESHVAFQILKLDSQLVDQTAIATARIKPCGPFGDQLRDMLQSDDPSLSGIGFGLRALVDQSSTGERRVLSVISWDVVSFIPPKDKDITETHHSQ